MEVNEKEKVKTRPADVKAEIHISTAFKAKRRKRVFDSKVEAIGKGKRHASYKIPRINKSTEAQGFIRSSLQQNLLLSHLSPAQLDLVVNAMKLRKVAASTVLFESGDVGDRFYIVESGVYTFYTGEGDVYEVKGGESFGELALLYDCPRDSKCVSPEMSSEIWVLDRRTFKTIMGLEEEEQRKVNLELLRSAPLLHGLSDKQLVDIVNFVEPFKFKPGEIIIHKGDPGNIFYFIKSGKVELTKIGNERVEAHDMVFGPGEYFGERALLLEQPRAATVTAMTHVECLTLDQQGFHSFLGFLKPKLDEGLGVRVLNALPLLNKLGDSEREKLFGSFDIERFGDGEKILEQGKKGLKFYIVKHGKVKVVKNMVGIGNGASVTVDVFCEGQYFGETCMVSDKKSSSDVISIGNVECFTLGQDSFNVLLHSLHDFLGRVGDNRKRNEDYELSITAVETTPFLLSDLEVLDIIGTGRFGTVRVVEHKVLKTTYALKAVPKSVVVKTKQQKHVVNEKDILQICNSPFIVKLYKTFKDNDCIYFLTEFIQGGELFGLLYNENSIKLSVKDKAFYSACVVEVLDYLHKKSIIYRDLKPENLLIDHNGYIRLIDFGAAKIVEHKTYTIFGTAEYLAPELVLHKGYNRSIDIWGLGILTYEMLFGRSPFWSKEKDQKYILKNILDGKFVYPKETPEYITSFISKLLARKPQQRIGMGDAGIQDIKEDPFFESLNWDELIQHKIPAPWLPDIRSQTDLTYFDIYEEEDIPAIKPYKPKKGDDWDQGF
eukprot:CAMPEP_0204865970 /NCGR_PEP_ID=MMETSP1348-20121228/15349_1 /ASSEMBLY_ACC=CAM_ASM_000700 /TAXON_ID=215587 /ORGANISM="Aplanochytrium stocchinoi, Strain GSBS06" /LENGTH=775 /DNA_ID=CAMNT_0052017635 /DNA_START=77 /DNA_END=2404 /DNA_ORIENTATION=+